MRFQVSRLRQDRAQHGLVVFHVELLGAEKLMNVVDPQPEVLTLVQFVQVRLLLLAHGEE